MHIAFKYNTLYFLIALLQTQSHFKNFLHDIAYAKIKISYIFIFMRIIDKMQHFIPILIYFIEL